jgi:hypothetical protein
LIELHSIPASQAGLQDTELARISQEVTGRRICGWYPAFLQELMTFPVGKHDDIVDALGLIGQMLATLQVASRPKPKAKKPDSGYSPFANVTQMEAYTSGGDDGWTQALIENGLGDERWSWRML